MVQVSLCSDAWIKHRGRMNTGQSPILDSVDPPFSFAAMPRLDIHAILASEGHMDFAKYFRRDPGPCGGETVITGTRVTLRTVLASLAEGSSFDEILKDYPSLSEDQLRAVVAFAAATAKEDLPLLPVPTLD